MTGFREALRDAFLSALVALGLFGPIIGLKTDAAPGGLILRARPQAVAIAVAAVFVGRLLLLLWRGRSRQANFRSNRRIAEALTRAGRSVAPVLLALAVLMPLAGDRYYIDL